MLGFDINRGIWFTAEGPPSYLTCANCGPLYSGVVDAQAFLDLVNPGGAKANQFITSSSARIVIRWHK